MLSMPAWGQCLGAALTAQAGSVPVLAQGGHLLSEVHSLVASRAHVGLPSERGDTRGFAGTLGRPAGLPLFSSYHRDLDGASDLRGLRRRLLVDVGTSAPDIHAFGSKQCGITGLVAEGFPIMLSMAARRQCLVAALTLEAELVPVLAQGAHLLGEVHGLVTLGTLGGHGRCARSVRALHPRSSLRRRPRLPRPPPEVDWLRDLGGASGARPRDASSWARCRRGAPARVGRARPSAPYSGVGWRPQGSPEDSMSTL